MLAQGLMEVANVSCSACSGVVGWKFVRDLRPSQSNRNQVGRFGLCTSSISVEEDGERIGSGAEEEESEEDLEVMNARRENDVAGVADFEYTDDIDDRTSEEHTEDDISDSSGPISL